MKYLLDTHTWIWWNMNPPKLSEEVLSLISDLSAYDEMLLSAISVWEFCKLLEKGRLTIGCDPEEWIKEALKLLKFRLVPISPEIAFHSTMLPGDFHDDPTDQIITATGRMENAVIITKDKNIQEYVHVKTFW